MSQDGPRANPDPVIEAYKKDVDRTLLRENLKLTPDERLARLEEMDRFRDALRDAASSSMDWDKFIAEGEETARTMRELSSRLGREIADSRAKRTRAAARDVKRLRAEAARDVALRDLGQTPSGPLLVRERPSGDGDIRLALAEIRHDLLMLRRDVMRELTATRVEVESIRGDIRLVAEGFA